MFCLHSRRGGKLVLTSMTGFFDENAHCIMMGDAKLKDLLGADLSEYKLIADKFDVNVAGKNMPVSLWKGLIRNDTAEVLSEDSDGITMISNKYGKGEVLWCPSMIEHGGWHGDNAPLADFISRYVVDKTSFAAITFAERYPDVLIKSLESNGRYMTFICNKSGEKADIELKHGKMKARTIFGKSEVSGFKIALEAEESVVLLWSK